MRPRVIPVLLLDGHRRLVKTRRFAAERYLGDPCNVIRIFNEKEVDEIAVLDINATVEARPPDLELARELAGECFMPLAYGGGITSLGEIERLFSLGVEKVIINAAASTNPELLREAAREFGSQSVCASIDVATLPHGRYEVRTRRGRHVVPEDPLAYARRLVEANAGEVLLNSIERDGEMNGYDLELIHCVSTGVGVPVVACGGAGTLAHMQEALAAGASAVAAGSMFMFIGRLRAVLITYPTAEGIGRELIHE